MRLLFALGDPDYMSSDTKAWRLALRLKQQLGCELIGVTNEEWVAAEARKLGLDCLVYPFSGTGVTIAQRLESIDRMIAATKNITIPGSDLHIWRILALDDFAGSLLLYGSIPTALPVCDMILMPLMGVDNNTKGACGLYVWLTSEAQKQKIPIIGIEFSPLGNKQTMSLLPCSAYAVKSAFARHCLIEHGYAPGQIALLNHADAYLISSNKDEYTEAFLQQEPTMRDILKIDRRQFVVVIPHHVGFLWEVKQLLRAILTAFQGQTYSVVMKADPNLVRRQYTEVDIVRVVYAEEIAQFPLFCIDTQIGFALLIQMADLILAPLSMVLLNVATHTGIPMILSQAAGKQGWESVSTVWESDPQQIPGIIRGFMEAGLFQRRLASIVEMVWAATEQQRAA